jgi:hypothetical protein
MIRSKMNVILMKAAVSVMMEPCMQKMHFGGDTRGSIRIAQNEDELHKEWRKEGVIRATQREESKEGMRECCEGV